ncbi:MAG TPA: DUF4157 domain-containing protein [Pseudonocardiaceae bacterium]|jgi:hypothetical protein
MHSPLRKVSRGTAPDLTVPAERSAGAVPTVRRGQASSVGPDFSRIPVSSRRAVVEGTSEDEAHRAEDRITDQLPAPGRLDGRALDGVRLHRDPAANALTAAAGALAITVGGDIYLSSKAPGLTSLAGRRLLAHELTHVAQQRRFGPRPQLFEAKERDHIAPTLDAMMAVVTALLDASSGASGAVDMDTMVKHAGGAPASGALKDRQPEVSRAKLTDLLTYRYLFTRRSGLIDMRHFFQLMYISSFFAGGVRTPPDMAARIATQQGVEHEETSERTSRYAPEDATSNALGAWTGTQLAVLPQRDDLIATVRATLVRSAPVDFTTLSAASQDAIVKYYSAMGGNGEPLNQNPAAVALVPNIPELAGTDRSFPFDLDPADRHRATIAGPAFDSGAAGLTGDTEIRDFLDVQRDEVIRDIPAAQRARLGTRLLQGWVSDADLDAFAKLYRLADARGQAALRAAANSAIESLTSIGQRSRLRTIVGG